MDEREILEKIKNRYGMRLDEQGSYIGFNRYKNIAVKTTFEAMYYTHYICFNGVFLSSNKQSQSCFMYGKSGGSNDKILQFYHYILYNCFQIVLTSNCSKSYFLNCKTNWLVYKKIKYLVFCYYQDLTIF